MGQKVTVLDENKKPLMPCSQKKARLLLERCEAKPYWKEGIFCIILQRPPKSRYMQEVCIGVDPGSRFNGYSVKSESDTLLNLQVEAVTTVKKKMEECSMLRRGRRQRKTPYRKCRFNRSVGHFLPPSTRARWQQHLNIIKLLSNLYPITQVALEDVSARTIKGVRKWNVNFSPLEVGKFWFESEVEKVLGLVLYKFKGYETYLLRQKYNLHKNKEKSKKDFYTHAVDAWCIANEVVGGHTEVDNTETQYWKPLMYHRRKLHVIQPKKGGYRRPYGGTISEGIKRGTLVRHPKWKLTIVGGSSKGRVSLHCPKTNKRLTQNAKLEYLKTLSNRKHIIN